MSRSGPVTALARPEGEAPWRSYVLAQAALAVCLASSAILAVQHVAGLRLPGCGPTSGCAELAAGPWGNLWGWPVSFLGVAWFAALSVFHAWAARATAPPALLRWALRAGGLASLGFLGVMLAEHHFCPYCLAVHAGNLVAWCLIEVRALRAGPAAIHGDAGHDLKPLREPESEVPLSTTIKWCPERAGVRGVANEPAPPPALGGRPGMSEAIDGLPDLPRGASLRPVWAAAAIFVGVSISLGSWQSAVQQDAASRAEDEFQRSLEKIVAGLGRQNQEPPATSPAGAGVGRMPADPAAPHAGDAEMARTLIGRWRRGPERAALRLVLFGDYECPHCRAVEEQITDAMAGRHDISLVFKHYPLCKECNRQIQSSHLHAHACRAAWAVEAAGLRGGNDDWWRLHDWMFARAARFSDTQLRAALPQLGFPDSDKFFAALGGSQSRGRVNDDVEDAIRLGIDSTPVLFINGFELAHPEIPDAVGRAVAAVSRAHPRPQTSREDRPCPGDERLLEIWKAGRFYDFADYRPRWSLGPADAPHRVILSLCHQNEYSPHFSQAVRSWAAGRSDVRVDFCHFPLTKQFNMVYARTRDDDYPNSYEMALIAEAAGRLGGNEAFWKMHQWLLDHQRTFGPQAAQAAAAGLGVDPHKLLDTAHSAAVRQAVDDDLRYSAAVGVQGAPSIFLGGRCVPSPQPSPALMERILQEMVNMSIR